MTKSSIHLLLMLTIVLFSCSKNWLDEKPDIALAVPTTLKDLQAILDDPARNTGSPAMGEMATVDFFVVDASFASRTDVEKNAYTWSKNLPYMQVSDWNSSYKNIFSTNIILEALPNITPENSLETREWNSIKGQSLFQRARYFFELSQLFAPSYKMESANTDHSIPLRLESDINLATARSTVRETYDQIINDIKASIELLPNEQSYKTRPSRIAAMALLARVYLAAEMYQDAKVYADSVLRNYNMLINYNTLNSALSAPIPRYNSEVIFYSTMINFSFIGPLLRVDDQLTNLYSENDLRKKVFFGTSGTLTTFKGNYGGSGQKFNGLATDELYLIRAECYAREGDRENAMIDLNHLLRNRWNSNVAYIDLTAVDADAALRKVLEERRKELLFRGLRWSDLRRLNQDPRFAATITRTVNGQTYTLEPNSYKYTFPIPDDIIQQSGIVQNPGWEK